MNLRNILKQVAMVLMVALLVMANTHAAKADAGIKVLGTISAINADAGVITVIGADGNVYYVPVPADKIANMVVGGALELHGTVAADGSVTFSADDSLAPDPALDPAPQDPANPPSTDYYCTQSTDQNPIGADLVTNYGADYAVLQQLACDYHMSWPDIQTLVSNAELLSVDPALLALAAKAGLDDEIIAQITHSTEADAEVIEDLLDQYQSNLEELDDQGELDENVTMDDIDGEDTTEIDDESGVAPDDSSSEIEDDQTETEVEDGADDNSEVEDHSGEDTEVENEGPEEVGYLFIGTVA